MTRIARLVVLAALLMPIGSAAGQPPPSADTPVFVAYYWRARPGKMTEYTDYINRAMPFDHPSTLTADEVYSAAAYVLFLNGIVGEQDVLDETTLPKVQMPNRNGFVADPRPDTPLKKK